MPYFRSTGHYAGTVGVGRGAAVRLDFGPGEVVQVATEDIADLIADAAPIDFDRVLSDAEVAELRAAKAAEQAKRVAREAEGRASRREWVIAHDGRAICPGTPGAGFADGPAEKPHEVHSDPADERGGLLSRWRESPTSIDGGWWIHACYWHVPMWERHPTPPPAPPTVDRQVRRYQFLADYRATYEGTDLHRHPATKRFVAVYPPGRLRFAAGEIVDLPGFLADWIRRDAGDSVLVQIDPDPPAAPVEAPAKPADDEPAAPRRSRTKTPIREVV